MLVPKFLLQRLWVKNSLSRTTPTTVAFTLENPFLLGHLIGVEALSINQTAINLATLQFVTNNQPPVSLSQLSLEAPLVVNHKQAVLFQFNYPEPVVAGKLTVALTAVSKETGAMSIVLEDTLITPL
jgi:hypothetical protein